MLDILLLRPSLHFTHLHFNSSQRIRLTGLLLVGNTDQLKRVVFLKPHTVLPANVYNCINFSDQYAETGVTTGN